MNNPKIKLLLLVSLLGAVAAAISAFAAGSHFQVGYSNGDFYFDFKVAVGESGAAVVLGLIALAAGLGSIGLYFSKGAPGVGEPGAPSEAAGSSAFSDFTGALRGLTNSKKDAWLGGVCGGLGEHSPLPSWVWRLVFLLLLLCYGTGVLVYVLLWICVPEPPKETEGADAAAGVSQKKTVESVN
jgi:phage shock protein PspC (stress-responsive transcriptional regulator)